ncbi:MAG: hypothetical protein A3H59_03380 [Candidatus Jacksonbacteria bacterium RIFCSPLOWO2_02_FULL_43_9]|nr:MAG: hypothetical protein UV70_C0001G0053 [Parcubacteria group bacterium GW2011_GWA2_43_13]OGY71605.1 MAG: hypothetical protein A2986_01700 [Candidatus Jacksonbacteria bacterium RIFCSPLOWO2_01_FULL_44_13]OGY73701.1 MAG: hypothetical protein A3H59_03380 [Candidatus Jacksonbacteria bacterium RIFCSPLOWO2_02_FULL_43_9]HAZ16601.1 hypothetical protein [Candidatus Jacksonbacteria bacterium]
METVTIKLPPKSARRLQGLALSYGLSLHDFSVRVLEGIASEFPKDAFANYDQPQALKSSFKRGIQDWHNGKVSSRL